jgi:predicted DCC family thiol-disulfide oxidoreductase YuxK
MTTRNGTVLIYDGECEFCRRWVTRLRLVTADRVEYLSSQEAAQHFPDIPPQKFQASVQLIQPDGSVYEGADAVFRTLAHNPNHGWPLWMYQKVPGVAPITEFLYRLVARNRNACGLRRKGS